MFYPKFEGGRIALHRSSYACEELIYWAN